MADWDQAEGKVKEEAGDITGDKDLEAEGRAQGAFGDVKEAAGDATDAAEDKWEDVKD
jgi:uncharacterized protein YjbJ (UPF0337 family)